MDRIFVARLAGLAVFDPAGDRIGRIRDVVVALRGRLPPRVHGLVVEVRPRRRVFLPITRIISVEAGAVIFTGRLNLRRFEQRDSETLAMGELLDRKVALAGDPATVLDLAMEHRPPDWLITKVAIRRGTRRRGETVIVDWDQVTGFETRPHEQGAASLLAAIDTMRPADLANLLHELPDKRMAEVAAALDDDRLADVLEELPERDQVVVLGNLAAERAADVLEEMGPDDAADLLQELPAEQAESLLQLMIPEEAEPVRRLLGYGEETAGGMMTTEPVILPPNATVAEALAHIRNPEQTPSVAAQVFVSRSPTETPTGRYLGLVHFQRLLREAPSTLIGSLLDTSLDPIRPDLTLPEVASYLATYNMMASPVVDGVGRLLGAVTVDDVLDHLLPEDWRESNG
ncbi:magnesium transporter MgtE N-terminal domain-containing protein [Acrocarpospora catenulata]|uniref:magnesium transporter MgtE N-terminal domain-containing protein n=1 Tax=Acrocarpospora catenulata TaxID=2836182 RepID=UPI001BD98A14|nr:CBS domain-containing protein [Acrocarpospora catenulata]